MPGKKDSAEKLFVKSGKANMSRIGQKPIEIPAGVSVTIKDGVVDVNGPKGKMAVNVTRGINVNQEGNVLKVTMKSNSEYFNALSGLNRTLVSNAVYGVSNLWTKSLELVGVGFRAQTTGKELVLALGFSHPVKVLAPEGITFAVQENKITVSGVDKYLVGEQAAQIRQYKPPEPYKGKGIRYVGEKIRKKAGKAKALGGAPGAK